MAYKGFNKKDRLLKRIEYQELSEKGKKVHGQHFVLVYAKNEKEYSRLGITVTKKVGNAVIRNRIKRYCREFFRQNRSFFIESKDINIIAKKYAVSLGSKQMFQTLENIFKKIN